MNEFHWIENAYYPPCAITFNHCSTSKMPWFLQLVRRPVLHVFLLLSIYCLKPFHFIFEYIVFFIYCLKREGKKERKKENTSFVLINFE